MSAIEIVCVGSAKCDTLARVGHQPGEDERMLTDRIVTAAGGNANTAAAAAARQGVSVALCTVLGRDPPGDFLLSEMQRFGVDTRFVLRPAGLATPQSINVACTDTATRFIITVASPVIPWEGVVQARPIWAHFDAEGFRAAREAIATRRIGCLVSVDAGITLDTRDLTGIDLYAPTRERIVAEFGGGLEDAMHAAHAAGARDVVVTLGPEGAAVLTGGVVTYHPGFRVDVVSTLGAGDVFHGALVAALVRGLDLQAAVRCANVSAALACRALDGQSAIPSICELTEHLDHHARATAASRASKRIDR